MSEDVDGCFIGAGEHPQSSRRAAILYDQDPVPVLMLGDLRAPIVPMYSYALARLITSQYLNCRSNRDAACENSIRSNTHSSITDTLN